MASNKFTKRRETAVAPHVCHPPPPPPIIPPWTMPPSLQYSAQSIVPGMEGNDVDNWSYVCSETVPGTYMGGGYSDMGHWSETQVQISPDSPPTFWIEVLYDASFYSGLYAQRGDVPVVTPQPHTYIFPPWDNVPAEGTLDAFLNF